MPAPVSIEKKPTQLFLDDGTQASSVRPESMTLQIEESRRSYDMETRTFAVKFGPHKNSAARFLWVALIALFLCPLSAFAQCTISWSGGASGSWDTAGNWTPAGPPSGTSNTCITTASSAVTIGGADATDNLTLGSTDSLTIVNGQSLSITAGGNISNAGNIILSGTANNTFLIIAGATTLSGGGTV